MKGNRLAQTITAKAGGASVPTAAYHKLCDTARQPSPGTLGSGWVVHDDTAQTLLASVSASNIPCAGGAASVQQYLPTGGLLARGTDRAWRYPQGAGGTPTGWRAGQNGLTMQSMPSSYMNATDSSGNKTCVPVALHVVDCSVSAEDAAYILDIQQIANTRARKLRSRSAMLLLVALFPCIVVYMGLGSNIRLGNEIRRSFAR